jgi:ABC-type bacteriocin/lantibiotic exporter with double-glycine peptidase domain
MKAGEAAQQKEKQINYIHTHAHYHCRRCNARFKKSNVTAINNCNLTLKANYRIPLFDLK